MSAIKDNDIRLKDELLYSFSSADNERRYETEIIIEDSAHPASIFGLIVSGIPRLVVGAPGGATIIDEHTLIRAGDDVLIAIGSYVCSYSLVRFELNWHLEVDQATCFGIYYSPTHDAYLSHGELSVTRFDLFGRILWQSGGADILTEGFRLAPDFIEVIDFNDDVYRFNYADGESTKAESGGGDRIAPVTPPTPPGMRLRTGRFQSDH